MATAVDGMGIPPLTAEVVEMTASVLDAVRHHSGITVPGPRARSRSGSARVRPEPTYPILCPVVVHNLLLCCGVSRASPSLRDRLDDAIVPFTRSHTSPHRGAGTHKDHPQDLPISGWGSMRCGGISLRLEPGTFTAVMGPSGSGKSTFPPLRPGLDTTTSGQVMIGGHDLSGYLSFVYALPPRARGIQSFRRITSSPRPGQHHPAAASEREPVDHRGRKR